MTILRRGEVLKAIGTDGHTMYIHKPNDIAFIQDTKDGLTIGFPAEGFHRAYIKTDLNARGFKRDIQDNSSEETAWLKVNLEDVSKTARIYVNSKYIVAIEGYSSYPNGREAEPVFYSRFVMHSAIDLSFKMHPGEANRQLNRVLSRLEQDEDVCCAGIVEPEE